MSYNIEAFHIGDEEFSSYSIKPGEAQDEDCIANLSKVNIFIGANNSGKSRFLRALFSKVNLRTKIQEVPHKELEDTIDLFKRNIESVLLSYEGEVYNSSQFEGELAMLEVSIFSDGSNTISDTIKQIENIGKTRVHFQGGNRQSRAHSTHDEIKQAVEKCTGQLRKIAPDQLINSSKKVRSYSKRTSAARQRYI